MRYLVVVFLSSTVFFAGCQPFARVDTKLPALTSTIVNTVTLEVPSPSPTQAPSTTLAPTWTPTLVPTPTLTPTPLLDPMAIDALRAGSYPGSDIVIEKELAQGSNYHRYYASYQSEGLKIYALLTVPFGDMPAGGWPAIVFNHGYIPPKLYQTTERYIAYVDDLARSGYIVFRIDYRGNGNSEGVARGAYGDPGYTIDVLNAIASIKRYPQANPQKIGIWGHSMGGFLALRAMVISKDIKAGVIWSGVVGSYVDLIDNWHHNNNRPTPTPPPEGRGWRSRWLAQYGTPEEDPQFWGSLSANSYLADLSGPLQLHHDTGDSEVPFAFSATLAQEIQAVGKFVELYSYPGDDHNLANPFSVAMARTIQFYNKYLK
jgi:fermentation-respiration switch protein FrsA (DUF1100 family)